MIREEKAVINDKMKSLKKSNDQYKLICENYMKNKKDYGANTDDIIEASRELIYVDQSIEC